MTSNRQWGVFKPVMKICFPRMFVEGRGEGAGFVVAPIAINTLIGFKVVPLISKV